MRILGIDPGSITMGYGIIQQYQNKQIYIASGCVRVNQKDCWSKRLKQIYDDVIILIKKYLPDQVAIEQVFVHKNANSALKLGQARGVAIVACACHNLPIAEYAPRQIKQAVVGYGNAQKIQVQQMVQSLLKLTASPQIDAADALAIAICHGHIAARQIQNKINKIKVIS